MDSTQFREFGKASVDYMIDYLDNIRNRAVLPNVQPGYLQSLIPNEVPGYGEPWQELLKDMDRVIMPGVTHWVSANFHAYCPTGNSYPTIAGDMMSAGIACIGTNWVSSPACTELEVAMMNWLGKMMNLPKEFLNCTGGPGGGVLQGSASESTLIGLLAAKEKTVKHYRKLHPEMSEDTIKSKLVSYTSEEANSSVEKASMLGSMPMRLLPTDEKCSFRGETLKKAIEKDKKAGLIPCYVVTTLGTTGTCAFDNLEEIGPLCNKENIWLHVDAAYAGAALICPEFRYLMKGIQFVDSFNFNPHKWLLTCYDCSAMWVKNSKYLIDALSVAKVLQDNKIPDYQHWQIPTTRRFRALKIWFVLRSYGVEGIQQYIRNHVTLAKYFEELVRKDDRFEVTSSSLGLICFRIKGDDSRTINLLNKLNERKNIYMIPAKTKKKFVIRFVVCSRESRKEDIDYAWKEITTAAEDVLAEFNIKKGNITSLITNANKIINLESSV